MIIEMFGPPAAGKTTVARALTRQLQDAGFVVESIVSNRPADWDGASNGSGPLKSFRSLISRLARPAAQAVPALIEAMRQGHSSARLLKLDPPRTLLSRLRLQRYLMQLSNTWERAARADHVVLFDQGYVQAACSLIQSGHKDPGGELREQLLDAIPKSDLLVGITAPRAVLEDRLRERLRRQGPLERILEFDLETNIESIAVIADLEKGLERRGRDVISISSLDQPSMMAGLQAVQRKLSDMPDCKKTNAKS